MSSIPVALFDEVTPSVLTADGDALDLVGLILTKDVRVPIGSVYSFSSGTAVTAFFGAGTAVDVVANGGVNKGAGYFGGFTNSLKKPGAMLVAQYPQSAVAAYLWGGNAAAALTLAQLQALSGSLTVVMDGYTHAISSISFAADNSFSAVAAAIQAAFTDPTESSFTASIGASFTGSQSGINLTTTSVTGIISVGDAIAGTGVAATTTIISQTSGPAGGAGVYVTSLSGTASSAACTASSTVLDVTVDTDHAIAVGQTVTGAGVTAGTLITAQLGGTAGGVGTYRLSGLPQLVASEAMTGVATAPLVTFDSTSGAFVVTSGITGAASTAAFATGSLAASILLTSATGAVLSQGAAAATPAGFMDGVVGVTTDWATFMTAFDPDGGSGSAVKQAFCAWNNSKNSRYAYVCFDTDITATANPPQAGCLGQILLNNGNSGTILIYEPSDLNLAAFVCGLVASIDFTATRGRTTLAFRRQAGLVASATTEITAVNLGGNPQVQNSFGNGYNYFGNIAASAQSFLWFQRGTCTGPFKWADSYVNQIWLNSALQGALAILQDNALSIPYTVAGDTLIETALADPIAAGLNFGAFAPGDIDAAQAAAVNASAGIDIANTLETQGYYLQILPATSDQRASRTSPPAKFWYLDRGSVQSLALASIALQ